MNHRLFRRILTAYVATLLLSMAMAFVPGGYSPALSNAYEAEPSWLSQAPLMLLASALVATLVLLVAGIVGLYRFRAWGRRLSLWLTAAAVAVTPFAGPVLESGWAAALWDASNLLWGAILALAYFSPVAASFGRDAGAVRH